MARPSGGAGVPHIVTCALTYGRGGLFFGGNVRASVRSPAGGDCGGAGRRELGARARGSRLRGTCRHVRRREHAHYHPRGAAFFLGVGAARGGRQAGRQAGEACRAQMPRAGPAGRVPRHARQQRAPRAVLWPVASSIATCPAALSLSEWYVRCCHCHAAQPGLPLPACSLEVASGFGLEIFSAASAFCFRAMISSRPSIY